MIRDEAYNLIDRLDNDVLTDVLNYALRINPSIFAAVVAQNMSNIIPFFTEDDKKDMEFFAKQFLSNSRKPIKSFRDTSNEDTSNDYGFYWEGENIYDKDGNHWYYGDYINGNTGIEPYSSYMQAVKETEDSIRDSFTEDEIPDPEDYAYQLIDFAIETLPDPGRFIKEYEGFVKSSRKPIKSGNEQVNKNFTEEDINNAVDYFDITYDEAKGVLSIPNYDIEWDDIPFVVNTVNEFMNGDFSNIESVSYVDEDNWIPILKKPEVEDMFQFRFEGVTKYTMRDGSEHYIGFGGEDDIDVTDYYLKALSENKINSSKNPIKSSFNPGDEVLYTGNMAKNLKCRIIRKIDKSEIDYRKFNPNAGDYYEIQFDSKLLGPSKQIAWEGRLKPLNNSRKPIKSSLEDRLVPYLEEFEEGYADALTSTDEMGSNASLDTFYEIFKSDYNLTDDDISKLEGAVQDIWHETEEENIEHDMGEMYGAPHGATPEEALKHFE